MNQKVSTIKIKDLVLWTENPRDPINSKASDQDVVDRALADSHSKWTLSKLAKEMGDFYDFSELPTVVYENRKPVVYDGNRRMILAKLKHGLVSVKDSEKFNLPNIPDEIPCNVCSRDIALQNVLRKHSDSGSWDPLERDVFLNKLMNREKSTFLILEESTGLISAHPHLNQRFVKDEIFKDDLLRVMGFDTSTGRLKSTHDAEKSQAIFMDISRKVRNKVISTRKNRGNIIGVLDKGTQKLFNEVEGASFHVAKIHFDAIDENDDSSGKARKTRRSNKTEIELFGGPLYLRSGIVSDLYRDISDLYKYYISNKVTLSTSFPKIIRMTLRLLCECAANDKEQELGKYVKGNFTNAKNKLNQDNKTILSANNVREETMEQLLHIGAHKYKAADNYHQTIAMSIVIGEMLKLTHGKESQQK